MSTYQFIPVNPVCLLPSVDITLGKISVISAEATNPERTKKYTRILWD